MPDQTPTAAADATAAPVSTIDQIAERTASLLDAGGPVVAVLLAISVVALAIILIKLYQFWSVRIGSREFVGTALSLVARGDNEQALTVLARSRNPIARVLETAIRARNRPGIPEATAREEVVRIANFYLERLRSYLRGLEVIGSLSPLLGLFGTVLGMIAAFQELEAAGNQVNASLLSRGIWEALLTTAVGLTVAIPAVAVATWMERRVDRLASDMEDASTRFFTIDLLKTPDLGEDAGDERARVAHSD